ncbi:MAG: chalcone isomerase family protein [Halofilum sp. (in: g-proteobacteria)]|nr:chalcone isomerase family protein [Halofilum sp. (in: g-proteobacteria)]
MPRILFVAVLLALSPIAHARTIEGVELPESVTARDGTALQLHGAGIRTKFFFDIYVGALYLTSTGQALDTIMASDQPARIEMHFVYDEVEAEKLESAWREGFADNNDREVLDTVEPQLENFVRMFPTAVEGDMFAMEYIPGQGTRVTINGEAAGTVAGDVFFNALLGVFLGPEPADDDLKEGMLGQ